MRPRAPRPSSRATWTLPVCASRATTAPLPARCGTWRPIICATSRPHPPTAPSRGATSTPPPAACRPSASSCRATSRRFPTSSSRTPPAAATVPTLRTTSALTRSLDVPSRSSSHQSPVRLCPFRPRRRHPGIKPTSALASGPTPVPVARRRAIPLQDQPQRREPDDERDARRARVPG